MPIPLTRSLLAELEVSLQAIRAPIADLWNPGLPPAAVDARLASLGLTAPDELRLWWSWHDGVDESAPFRKRVLGNGWVPLSLERAIENTLVARAMDDSTMANTSWSPDWVTILEDVATPRIAAACDAPASGLATIHLYDPERVMDPDRPRLGSLGDLVTLWLSLLRDGTWSIEPQTGEFGLVDLELHERFPGDLASLL